MATTSFKAGSSNRPLCIQMKLVLLCLGRKGIRVKWVLLQMDCVHRQLLLMKSSQWFIECQVCMHLFLIHLKEAHSVSTGHLCPWLHAHLNIALNSVFSVEVWNQRLCEKILSRTATKYCQYCQWVLPLSLGWPLMKNNLSSGLEWWWLGPLSAEPKGNKVMQSPPVLCGSPGQGKQCLLKMCRHCIL